MQKVKKIKRVDHAVAMDLFYCQYVVGRVFGDGPLVDKLNDLMDAVFNIKAEGFRAQQMVLDGKGKKST